MIIIINENQVSMVVGRVSLATARLKYLCLVSIVFSYTYTSIQTNKKTNNQTNTHTHTHTYSHTHKIGLNNVLSTIHKNFIKSHI